MVALVRSEAVKNGVSVRTELAEGLPLILGDRVQIQQVLLNLIINALEAMTVGEEPRELLISSRKSEKGGVHVAVRDSGPGLGQADLERVFAAFYTTSPAAWAWAWPSVGRSARRKADGSGPLRMRRGALCLSSRCLRGRAKPLRPSTPTGGKGRTGGTRPVRVNFAIATSTRERGGPLPRSSTGRRKLVQAWETYLETDRRPS